MTRLESIASFWLSALESDAASANKVQLDISRAEMAYGLQRIVWLLETKRRISRTRGLAALPRRDKVVSLLDKIQNVRHGNPPNRFAALETHLNGIA